MVHELGFRVITIKMMEMAFLVHDFDGIAVLGKEGRCNIRNGRVTHSKRVITKSVSLLL